MERFLTSGQVQRVLGISARQLARWIRDGIVPTIHGRGKGQHHHFQFTEVFAIAIGRDLCRRGLSVSQSGRALEFLLKLSTDQLEAAFREGRVLLLQAGDGPACPRLLSRGSISEDDLLAMHLKGVPVAVVDVEACFRKLIDALKTEEAARQVTTV